MDTITKQEISQVVKLKEEEELSFEEIGAKLGFSRTTASRRYQASSPPEEVLEAFPALEELEIKVSGNFVPEDKGPIERFKPLTCVGDAILTADYHIPLHDPKLINVMIECARRNKIKQLVIAGDYWNMDEFSSYLPMQPEAAIDVEKLDGNIIMKTLLKTFDDVYFIWGNHDFRLTKKMGFKKSFDECMKWMLSSLTEKEWKKVHISELDHMNYLPTKNSPWKVRLCHPRSYSDIPLAVGKKLAIKYGCSVATAHSHHCAIGAAPNGVDILIEMGGFFDKNRTEYIQRTTDNHEWVQGFTMFKDGLPTLICPMMGTDRAYRKEVKS